MLIFSLARFEIPFAIIPVSVETTIMLSPFLKHPSTSITPTGSRLFPLFTIASSAPLSIIMLPLVTIPNAIHLFMPVILFVSSGIKKVPRFSPSKILWMTLGCLLLRLGESVGGGIAGIPRLIAVTSPFSPIEVTSLFAGELERVGDGVDDVLDDHQQAQHSEESKEGHRHREELEHVDTSRVGAMEST